MRFRRARFKNYRLLTDLELDFSVDSSRPLTVIRAENETGKTTILNALQWLLFGEEGLPGKGANYRMHPLSWDTAKSKRVDIEGELEFEHTFQRKARDGQWDDVTEVFIAIRHAMVDIIDADRWSRQTSEISLLRKTDNGYAPHQGGELFIRQILGSNLKDLFFTDGDQALTFISSTLSAGDKRKLVQKAIRDMLGFQILENARGHINYAIKQFRGQVKNFAGAEELQRAADRETELDGLIEKGEARLDEIQSELSEIASSLEVVEQKINTMLAAGDPDTLMSQIQGKRAELQKARKQLGDLKHKHSSLFRSESLASFLLKEYLDKASAILNELTERGRIPRTAIPVLQSRLDIGVCICGAPLTPGQPQHQHILKLIEEGKSSSEIDDRLTSLRVLANQRYDDETLPGETWRSELKTILEGRSDLEERIEQLESETKLLEIRLEALPRTDIGVLRETRSQLLRRRDDLNREQGTKQAQMELLRREKHDTHERYEDLLGKQSKAAMLRARLVAAGDIWTVINNSYEAIEKDELPQVSASMNRYFMEMIGADPDNAIIQRAEVTPDYDIAVYGPQGQRLDPDRDLNGASRRALTLAFILALTEVSGVTAPNVIDTPLGMTSYLVKQFILKTVVSHAHQVVLFLTRSEIRDCEDILDASAGRVITLTNAAHYPLQLRNDPGEPYARVQRCECNHRQYCSLCERLMDSENPALTKRA